VLKCIGIAKYCDGTCELDGNGWIRGPNQRNNDKHKLIEKNDNEIYNGKFNEDVNYQWYNVIWGNTAGQWKCDKSENPTEEKTCKPQVDIKYVIVRKPEIKKSVCLIFLPVCKQIKRFKCPYNKNNFHGFNDVLPDKYFIQQFILTSYNRNNNQQVSINELIEIVFGDQARLNAYNEIDNIKISIDTDINIQNQFDVKQNVMGRNLAKIPAAHRNLLNDEPMLYYLFFYLLITNNVITPDTVINPDYCVRDALFYIIQVVWKLDVNVFNVPQNVVTRSPFEDNKDFMPFNSSRTIIGNGY